MKIITNLAMTLIILSVGWMTIQTIYGVGRAKGYVQARQQIEEELRLEYEQKMDEEEDICVDLIQEAIDNTREEILGQF